MDLDDLKRPDFIFFCLIVILVGILALNADRENEESPGADIVNSVRESSSFKDLQGESESEINISSDYMDNQDIDQIQQGKVPEGELFSKYFIELFKENYFQLNESYIFTAENSRGRGYYYQVDEGGEVIEQREISQVRDALRKQRLEDSSSEELGACPEISGFPDSVVKVMDFEAREGNLVLNLTNSGSTEVNVTEVKISRKERESTYRGLDNLPPGDSVSITVEEVLGTEYCADLNMMLTYQRPSGERQSMGALKGSFRLLK